MLLPFQTYASSLPPPHPPTHTPREVSLLHASLSLSPFHSLSLHFTLPQILLSTDVWRQVTGTLYIPGEATKCS